MRYAKWLVAVAVLVAGTAVYQFFFASFGFTPPGYADDGDLYYPLERVEPGVTTVYLDDYGLQESWERGYFYIMHLEDAYAALTGRAGYLGCNVPYIEDRHRFVDPCYGGEYDVTGRYLSGPPVDDYQGTAMFATRVEGDHLVISDAVIPWHPWTAHGE